MPLVSLNRTQLFYTPTGAGGLPCLVMHGGLAAHGVQAPEVAA